MSEFFTCLEAIKTAQDADSRKKAVKAAKQAAESSEIINANWDNLQHYAGYGAWVNDIPSLIMKNEAKKHLKTLIEILAAKNEIEKEDNERALILKIRRCKSIDDLNELEKGEVKSIAGLDGASHHINISLQNRIKRLLLPSDSNQQLQNEIESKRRYLKAKHRADKAAWPITIILCLLGVGVVCGIAMFAAFPFILTTGLVAVSLVVGYVEIPVFYAYVKRSLRNLFVRGVFNAIDNHLLKEEVEELKKERPISDRHELSKDDENAILKKYTFTRIGKYLLTVLGGLLAAASTFGFSALAYMQVVEVLPLFGIAAGMGSIVIPWSFTILAGLYFFVIFHNIFNAIKNNIFKSIWHEIVNIFGYENWQKAGLKQRLWHVVSCLPKVLTVIFVFGIAVVATVFTAGAWLQSSVSFFSAAFGIANMITDRLGYAVGIIQLVTNFGFSLENSFKTVGRSPSWQDIKNRVVAYVDQEVYKFKSETYLPKKLAILAWALIKPIIYIVPLTLHVIGVGLLAAKGLDATLLQPTTKYESVAKWFIVLAQALCELLEDAHTLMHEHNHEYAEKSKHEHHQHDHHHAHHEEHKRCDNHEHANPVADIVWLANKGKAAVTACYGGVVTLFKKCKGEIIPEAKPELIAEHDIEFSIANS